MSRGQLAILPSPEGRTAERRIVNLAARLREPGASIFDAEVKNLSTDGFMATVPVALEPGTTVWLRLPGLEPQNSRVVWFEDGKAGFQFANPIHRRRSSCSSRPTASPSPSAISVRRAERPPLDGASPRRAKWALQSCVGEIR